MPLHHVALGAFAATLPSAAAPMVRRGSQIAQVGGREPISALRYDCGRKKDRKVTVFLTICLPFEANFSVSRFCDVPYSPRNPFPRVAAEAVHESHVVI